MERALMSMTRLAEDSRLVMTSYSDSKGFGKLVRAARERENDFPEIESIAQQRFRRHAGPLPSHPRAATRAEE